MTRLHSPALKIIVLFLLLLQTHYAHAVEPESILRGRVIDYLNNPVIDAQIWVSRNRVVYTTKTNENGKFIINDLPHGKIEVVAYKEGFSFAGTQGQFLGDGIEEMMLDKSKTLDLRITNTRHEPVEGARLKVLGIGHTVTINAEDLIKHGFPSFRSDEKGIMRLPGMPRFGVISVTASHPDYADSNLPTFPVGSGVGLMMVDGIKLRGRITNTDGKGVALSRVTLFKSRDGRNQKYTEVMTDNEGFYTLTAPPARYFVAARHAQYSIPTPQAVWLRASDNEVITDLKLLPAYFIHGKTVTKSGEPVPLTTIAYRKKDGTTYSKATSGRDGHYTLTVPAGEGTLVVTPPARMMAITAPVFPIHVKKKINIDLGDIVLSPLPEITGHVIDRDGKPVPNAFVRSRNTTPITLTQTDEEGNFLIQLEKLSPEQKVSIYVEHPYRFLRRDVPLKLTDLKPLNIKLKSYRPKLGFMPELSLNNLSSLLGEPAPEWTCQDWFNLPEGKESLSLADYKGKIIILTLWASFDLNGSTQQRMEELNYLHEIYKDRDDVAFLSIHDAGLVPNEIDFAVRKMNIQYPVGCDTKEFETFTSYRVNQIPQTIIIDKQGLVKYYEVDIRLHTLIKAMLRK